MACYISSNNNRVYAALESSFGAVAAVSAPNRVPVVKLDARQKLANVVRKDKTGSRTFVGLPNHVRRQTDFTLTTPMTEWGDMTTQPSHGPLFQASMGGAPKSFSGASVASATSNLSVTTAAAHGLTVGQAVTSGGEIRFVTAVASTTQFFLNAPFSAGLAAGAALGATMSYPLANGLGSATLYDYWDPVTAVQRVVTGAVVDGIKIKVNGDFHELEFSGQARDLVDSASFSAGQLASLTQFPAEPAQTGFDYTVVPGNLGQVWLGSTASQFQTITSAEFQMKNNVSLRSKEFGSDFPRCIAGGQRTVSLQFSLFSDDSAQTTALYQAARQRSPISAMLMLGQQTGQMIGIYMPAMIPEVPEYDDSNTRLAWSFQNSRAQGSVNDELYIAFG